jgi:proton glutamate symport protein
MKKLIPIAGLILIAVTTAISTLHHFLPDIIPQVLAVFARWTCVAALSYFAFKRNTLTAWILFAIILGAVFGHDLPGVAVQLKVLSKIFIQLVKTIIAPLIFSTLVVGIAGHSDLKQVGRMGWKSLLYFEIVTTFALFIGLAAINISQAGVGIHLPPADHLEKIETVHQEWDQVLLHVFPENIAKSVAEGAVLQIVVFSVLFGIALAMLPPAKKQPILIFCESLSEVMFKFTNIIMYFAPIGVGAAIAYTVGHVGLSIFQNLAWLLCTLYLALFAFILMVLLPIALLARIPILKFAKAIAEPVSIAFSTTSSEAALPSAMEALEGFGVPRKIIAFVLPTGYSFNLDGTTLYLALASIFVAQAANIHMSISEQLVMMFTLMLTSKGVAGVPRASLVILMGTAASFHLPVEIIFIILGIDELMDMGRTSVNVIGNCLATVVIAKWEGEFNTTRINQSE